MREVARLTSTKERSQIFAVNGGEGSFEGERPRWRMRLPGEEA